MDKYIYVYLGEHDDCDIVLQSSKDKEEHIFLYENVPLGESVRLASKWASGRGLSCSGIIDDFSVFGFRLALA
jgi:hypothetical protein